MSKLVVYKASAGSGKTFRLAAEYIKMVVSNPLAYKKILAVTFTNKATAEMKERILLELYKLSNGTESAMRDILANETGLPLTTLRQNAKEALSNILHDYSMFSISTIDSFVQRVIQNLLWEIGFHGNNELRLDYELILEKAVDRLLDSSADNEDLFVWFQNMIYTQLENKKSPDIRKTLIELGAQIYSEQFRLLTPEQSETMSNKLLLTEIAKYVDLQLSIIAETISKKGTEIIETIESKGFSVDDFSNKSAGVYGFISKASKFDLSADYPEVKQRTLDAINDPSGERWMSNDFKKSSPGRASELTSLIALNLHGKLVDLVNYIDNNKKQYFTTEAIGKNLNTLAVINDIRSNVKEILAEDNAMILADSGPLLREFIKGNDAPFVYEKIGTRYDCFMLDEFQDTSVIQWQNFKPLIGNSLAQNEFSLVVGDTKQAIYRWRNSDWRILAKDLEEDFPLDIRNLTNNHRSQYQIVNFNNVFFTGISTFLNDWTNSICDGNPSKNISELVTKVYENPVQKCTTNNLDEGFVEISHLATSDKEITDELIRQRLEKLIPNLVDKGYSIGDIAILVRKKDEGKRIADILLSLKNKFPDRTELFNVVSQDALQLNSSHAVRLCVAAMKLILNYSDKISQGILSKEIMVVAKTTIDWEFTFLHFDIETEKQWLSSLRNQPLTSMYELIIERYNLYKLTKELPYLALLHEQIIDISKIGTASLPYFAEWWQNVGSTLALSMPESRDAINILTIHKSKGLQFPVVIVPYASSDIFKHDSSKVLWVNTDISPYSKYPLYPISHRKTLKDSYFKEIYLDEKIQTMIDSVNLLYVAFTRPEKELYIFVEAEKINAEIQSTSDIILDQLNKMNISYNTVNELNVESRIYTLGNNNVSGGNKNTTSTNDVWLLEHYPVGVKQPNIAQQLEATEFFKETQSAILASIEYGKVMHKLFSLITVETDIEQAIHVLQIEGVLTSSQIETLGKSLHELLQKEPYSNWFSGKWNVKTEMEILNNNGKIYRPDRVMIQNDKVIVVDYKFGEQLQAHQHQIRNYMQLLENMGYSNIQGYIWYVDSGNYLSVQS